MASSTKSRETLQSVPASPPPVSPQADFPGPDVTSPDLDDPRLYLNRELSLLEFQARVLEEAQDPTNPLLERIKFLSILSSNLDEFFMVRVAGLIKQLASGAPEAGIDGRPVTVELQLVRERVCELARRAHDLLNSELLPALEIQGVRIVDYSRLLRQQQSAMTTYFVQNVFPVLTPLAFDPGRPFPHISNRSLNLAVVLLGQEGVEHFARST